MRQISIFSGKVIKQALLAVLLEFGPVLIFLTAFEFFHIYKATVILIVTTILSTFVTFRIQKRLPYVALYIALLTSIFGYMTIMSHQPQFIQMRDTLYDVTSALTLIIGLMINVKILKLACHDIIPMTNRAWNRLTYAWIAFFLSVAIANEYVRRVMSLEDWFMFKSWMIVVTVLFGCLVTYFFYEKEEK